MSNTDRISTDPRHHSLYQRDGGTGTGADTGADTDTGRYDGDPEVGTTAGRESLRSDLPSPAPRSSPSDFTEHSAAETYPAPSPPAHADHEDRSMIRELGAEEPDHGGNAVRNPFDRWIWGVAAVLLALGVFLTLVPVLFAESIQEQMQSRMQSSYYVGHWSNYTGSIATPLILVGAVTAVAQLFVLSGRHARRTR